MAGLHSHQSHQQPRPPPLPNNAPTLSQENRLVPKRNNIRQGEDKSVVERRFAAAAKPKIERLFSTYRPSETRFSSFGNVNSTKPVSAFVRAHVNGVGMAAPIPNLDYRHEVNYRLRQVYEQEDYSDVATSEFELVHSPNLTDESSNVGGLRRWLRRLSIRPSAKNARRVEKQESSQRHRSVHRAAVEYPADNTLDSMTPSAGADDTAAILNPDVMDANQTPWASGSWRHSTQDHVELRFCTNADSSEAETIYRIE